MGYMTGKQLSDDSKRRQRAFEVRFKALYEKYKPDMYWFFLAILLLKLLSGLSIGFAKNEFYAQISLSLFFYLAITSIIIWKRPFTSKETWAMEIANHAKDCLVMIL